MADAAAPMSDPFDLLDLGSLLGEQERDIQRTARDFLAEHARPYIADWFERAFFQIGRAHV